MRKKANNPTGWDEKAHVIVSDILDKAEQWAERTGRCVSAEATHQLCAFYIKELSIASDRCTSFSEVDERLGAEIFLASVCTEAKLNRLGRRITACAEQLAGNRSRYFPDFPCILRQMALDHMASAPDLAAIERRGLLMVAAASLPGFLTDLRRERRRRGALSDRTIVKDATLARRLMRIEKLPANETPKVPFLG